MSESIFKTKEYLIIDPSSLKFWIIEKFALFLCLFVHRNDVLFIQIEVTQINCTETVLRNLTGPAFRWQAKFAGQPAGLWVDGVRQQAEWVVNGYGQLESWVTVDVAPGATHTVKTQS